MFAGMSMLMKAGSVLSVLAAIGGIVIWLESRGAFRNEAKHVEMQLEQMQDSMSLVVAQQVNSNDTVVRYVEREGKTRTIIQKEYVEVIKYADSNIPQCVLSTQFVTRYDALTRLRTAGQDGRASSDPLTSPVEGTPASRVTDAAILREKYDSEISRGEDRRQLEAIIEWEEHRYELERQNYERQAP